MHADGDNTDVEPHPLRTSLFVNTSINKPSASYLMVESDQEDEEDPYSNIGLPPTTMAPTVPIVHQPVTVSNPILQRSSSVLMLSDDEQETDEEQGANQYMQPVALVLLLLLPPPPPPPPPPLPQQVTKPQKMKKTITDVSRRFSTRILSGKEQETVKGKQKKERFGNANSCCTGSH